MLDAISRPDDEICERPVYDGPRDADTTEVLPSSRTCSGAGQFSRICPRPTLGIVDEGVRASGRWIGVPSVDLRCVLGVGVKEQARVDHRDRAQLGLRRFPRRAHGGKLSKLPFDRGTVEGGTFCRSVGIVHSREKVCEGRRFQVSSAG